MARRMPKLVVSANGKRQKIDAGVAQRAGHVPDALAVLQENGYCSFTMVIPPSDDIHYTITSALRKGFPYLFRRSFTRLLFPSKRAESGRRAELKRKSDDILNLLADAEVFHRLHLAQHLIGGTWRRSFFHLNLHLGPGCWMRVDGDHEVGLHARFSSALSICVGEYVDAADNDRHVVGAAQDAGTLGAPWYGRTTQVPRVSGAEVPVR